MPICLPLFTLKYDPNLDIFETFYHPSLYLPNLVIRQTRAWVGEHLDLEVLYYLFAGKNYFSVNYSKPLIFTHF